MILLLAGCAAFTTGTQVQSGRRALLVNDPEWALPYFLEAAQNDPNYVYRSVYFHEGIWTYVGRTQYATKRYAEARQSLERALSLDRDDLLARLYLGLTLVRSGDGARGAKEILAGMKGIYDWIDYMQRADPSKRTGIRCGKSARRSSPICRARRAAMWLFPRGWSPTASGSATKWKTKWSACARTKDVGTSVISTAGTAARSELASGSNVAVEIISQRRFQSFQRFQTLK